MEISWLEINNSNSVFLQNYNSLNSATIPSTGKTAAK